MEDDFVALTAPFPLITFAFGRISACSGALLKIAILLVLLRPFRRYHQTLRCHLEEENTVLIAHESGELLSLAASERYAVVQVKSILQPITKAPHLNQPFLYVDFFNFSHSLANTFDGVRIVTPAPVTDMFLVHRHVRSNNTALGDIVPLESVHQVIQLIPKFGQQVSASMNCDNSLQLAREFYVNNFADKETFHAILSYQ
ncbi:hypothetical protein DFJ58DRAFT_712213 [Suillus subalutaceus]|uniref:uncharacterized protein n=1 Tax=Suillus subalutaceus TaxID=48586 RepID=UPI001B8660BA|nr:uncharacterized protein DFJ58DRAFT_712213 [Suillus subalutaceus]KAG1816300.1 hypothetical protein DFJ58DRAFT_712213 [Suillus subalutaceus]